MSGSHDPYALLFATIAPAIGPSTADAAFVRSLFVPRHLGKGEFYQRAGALNSTAEERYLDFVKRHPSIVTRVPQRMLASYLGMAPETLSRLRGKLRG